MHKSKTNDMMLYFDQSPEVLLGLLEEQTKSSQAALHH
jgi:hypothetical protein